LKRFRGPGVCFGRKRLALLLALGAPLLWPALPAVRAGLLASRAAAAAFPLVRDGRAATFVIEPSAAPAISRAGAVSGRGKRAGRRRQ
jgi:hypothetical protein